MYKLLGGCYCNNVTFEMKMTGELGSYEPRACDCDFCSKHGASYVSDTNGKLTIFVKDDSNLSKYKQGSGIADFLICKTCGVLVGACYEEQGQLYAAINSKAIDEIATLGPERVVSPKLLSDEEKIQRWKEIWFSDAKIKHVYA